MPGHSTLELPSATPEMVQALRFDRLAIMRDAVLWQRPMRLGSLAVLVILPLLFGPPDRLRAAPALALVALAYTAVVLLTARAARHRSPSLDPRIPAVLLSADILAISAIAWATRGLPGDAARLLLPACFVVLLATYYFGRTLGAYCLLLSGAAYLVVALGLPGADPAAMPGAIHTGMLYLIVGSAHIAAFAAYRRRMDQLRLFCRLIEEGVLSPTVPVGVERRPDDLTLLSRSVDTMRVRLAEQIGTDPLTACLNRRALETRLRGEWRQAKRRNTTVAVLAVDIDHFKQINDSRGHAYGDAVLKELASIFKGTARDTDTIARLGGDEFVALLPDTGWQGALTFAERMRRKVEERAFGPPGETIQVTISVGVALARGSDPMSPEALLLEADRALYKAKTAGRNRIFA